MCSVLRRGKSGISPKCQVIQIVQTERFITLYNIKYRQMILNLHFKSFSDGILFIHFWKNDGGHAPVSENHVQFPVINFRDLQ
jgi:hypothetical protein